MDVTQTDIPDVLFVKTRWFQDARGAFSEVYSRRAWQSHGLDVDFCQDNHAMSSQTGTVRGLHFQTPPSAQAKLVRVVYGAVLALLARQGLPGGRYMIGGECEATNIELMHKVCDLLDEKVPGTASRRNLITHVADRPGHDRRYAADCSHIRAELGWRPSETLDSGLSKTIAWYLANDAWCAACDEDARKRRGTHG